MTTRYLLPCTCGNQNPVDAGKAGQAIKCACGAVLEVPTMRGLGQLARAEEPAAAPTWGMRQGLVFIGLIIAVLGFGYGGYLYTTLPEVDYDRLNAYIDQEVEQYTVKTSLAVWESLKNGMPQADTFISAAINNEVRAKTNRITFSILAGVVGLLIAAGSRLVRAER